MDPAWKTQARDILPASSRPMLGGLGREGRIRAAFETLRLHERRELAKALDEVMRPMSVRELDEAMLATGLTRSDRKRLLAALKPFSLLMVVGDEG